MKKLKLDFQHLNAEILTRSQLKQILGGDGSGGGGIGDGSGSGSGGDFPCSTSCSGDVWNSSALRYDRKSSPCVYTPPISGLPGSCDCPYSTNATACS